MDKTKVTTTNQDQLYETVKDENISSGLSNTNEIYYLQPRSCNQELSYIEMNDINVVCLRQ